jgi:hypothetical protein
VTLQNWKDLADIVKNVASAIAIVVGGGWALWRFVLQLEAHARIEFDLDLRVLGSQGERLLVEVLAIITNRGVVRHWLSDLRFDLHHLRRDQELVEGDDRINRQVLFDPLVRKRYWIPPVWRSSFIDPGVTQRYTYVTSIPADSSYLLLYAQFKYPDQESEFHTAQKTFRVGSATTVEPKETIGAKAVTV